MPSTDFCRQNAILIYNNTVSLRDNQDELRKQIQAMADQSSSNADKMYTQYHETAKYMLAVKDNMKRKMMDHDKEVKRTITDIAQLDLIQQIQTSCGPKARRLASKAVPSTRGKKFDGCNGVDDNGDGVIDDCDEDRWGPHVDIPSSTGYRKGSNGAYEVPGTVFNGTKGALSFLVGTLESTDDCATSMDQGLELLLSVIEEKTCKATVEATPIHVSHCGNRSGTPKRFEMGVDTHAPTISCKFLSPSVIPGLLTV